MGDEERRLADAEWKGKVIQSLDGINEKLDRVNGRLDKHGDRIGSLEQTRALAVGGGTVLGAISGWVSAHFGGGK